MPDTRLVEAAQMFRILGHESRLRLLTLLGEEHRTVGHLASATSMPQPLVSQHLRTLRLAGLVTGRREGKNVIYSLADAHVAHVIADTLAHVTEHGPPTDDAEPVPTERNRTHDARHAR